MRKIPKWLAPCFRSEKYILTVELNSRPYKLLQIMFRKKDGSLFITFPYYAHTNGIVSLATLTPEMVPPRNLNLEIGGKAVSHLVKYSHHPDGRAHFSQDGKIYTAIKKQSVPINNIQGHVFTVQLQGLTSFEVVNTNEYNLPPTNKRAFLNFSFGNLEPKAIKIVGNWYSQAVLMSRVFQGTIGKKMTVVNPQGKEQSAFLCSSPQGHIGEDRILMVTCEGIPLLDKDNETALTFIAGFDGLDVVNDLSKSTTFLALSYPTKNPEELAQKIGSIDFTANTKR